MNARWPTYFNVWPVVQRELREGARRPFIYWLRVGAGTAGLLMVLFATRGHDANEQEMGQFLFSGLHHVLMGLICLVVPWMTADCIAREKREGTLGLLFLTPLTAGGIVLGKGLAQTLRALTLWVSVAPMLTIPFLTGGVGWEDASAALALEFSALVLCLAAGLLASTLVKGRGAAFVLALLLGVFFVSAFSQLVCFCFLAQIPLGLGWPRGYAYVLRVRMDILLGNVGLPPSGPGAAATIHLWHLTLWLSPILALLMFFLVLRFAAWRMAASWRDKIPSPRQESLIRTYCTPLFQRWFARRTRRTLDRNPIAWLQQYSWKARLGKWVLCLAFVAVEAAVSISWPMDGDVGETTGQLLLLTLAAGMTFAGINSFAEEKRSGALELILITPVSVNQIIFGRVWGVWKQFLPAGLMLAGFDVGIHWLQGDLRFNQPGYEIFSAPLNVYLAIRLLVVCVLMTLPVFALYFALRVKNMIVAAGMTWAVICLPFLFAFLFLKLWVGDLSFYWEVREFDLIPKIWVSAAVGLGNVALALVACFLLRHSLSRRIYSF